MESLAPAHPVRVAIYARQSVKADEGIDQQIKHCRVIAEDVHGWQVAKIYQDNNTSASKIRGKGTDWAEMLNDFDSGVFDVLMGVTVDRLLRRVVDVVDLRKSDTEGGRKQDVRIVTARDGIDTATPTGNTLLTILVALAEGEIETKKARNVPYAVSRHKAGHPTAGKVPHGYRWIPKLERESRESDRRYEVVDSEAADVRKIFEEILRGTELGAIAQMLNSDKQTTRTTRTGARWRSPTIRRIALSPFYAGLLPEMRNGREAHYTPEAVDLDNCIEGDWVPIVKVDTLRAVRAKLLLPERRKNGGMVARKWLLSGLARCGAELGPEVGEGEVRDVCGLPVRSAKTREGYHGYRCPAGHFLRRGDLLDEFVAERLIQRLSEPDAASLVTVVPEFDVPALRGREAVLTQRAAELLALVAEGTYTAAVVAPWKTEIDAELVTIRAQLEEVTRVDPLAELTNADDVRAVWERLPLGRKRHVLDALLIVLINPVGKGRRVRNLDDASASTRLAWRHNRFELDGTLSHPIPESSAVELATLLS